MPQVRHSLSLLLLPLFLLLHTTGAGAAEQTLRCASCNQPIQTSYYRAGGQAYCSQRCLVTSLPKCDECGRRLSTEHLVWRDQRYCSRECLDQVLPKCEICGTALQTAHVINGRTYCEQDAGRPRCEKCGQPFVRGFELGDGRKVCATCDQSLIYRLRDAQPYYRTAQVEVARVTGLRSSSIPPLHLVGLDDLQHKTGKQPAAGIRQRGLYDRTVVVETTRDGSGRVTRRRENVTKNIYILYGLAPDEFTATAAHELTHDLLAEHYPDFAAAAPDWAEEGICQYVAAAVARALGHETVLNEIETNPDPAYGDGYRWLKLRFGDDNWTAIQKWLNRIDPNSLPEQLPSP